LKVRNQFATHICTTQNCVAIKRVATSATAFKKQKIMLQQNVLQKSKVPLNSTMVRFSRQNHLFQENHF